MMRAMRTVMVAALALAAAPVAAQPAEPGIAVLAQMLDRCMATYAVQMTRTDTADEAIHAAAQAGCREIDTRLKAAVRAQGPAAQAEELIGKFDASAKPNFMALLARIRADRARQATPPQ